MRRHDIACAAALFLASACGGSGDSGTTPTQPSNNNSVVASVVLAGTATVEAGKTTQLSAQARNASGTAIAGKAFTWSSSSEAVATVSSDGTVSGKAAGTSTISAAVDGKSGSLTVTVTAAPPTVAFVTVSGSQSLEAGATTKLTAAVKDAAGAVIADAPVTWSTSDPTIMTVSGDGTVSALRIATATITATAGGKTGSLVLTSSLTPYTFSFPDASAADAQRIKDAVQFAHSYFQKTFGRTITKPTTVTGASSAAGCDARAGNAAFAQPQSVIYCISNIGWTQPGPIMKQKIAIHELFHVWQYEYKWLGAGHDGAAWIVEGSAELVGFNGVDGMALLPLATSRGCAVKEVTDFKTRNPPGLPALNTVESLQAWQSVQGPMYPFAFTAMDQLTAGAGGLASLKTFSDAVVANNSPTGWQAAFQTAFGTSTSAFYGQYPTYYNSLPVPPNYLCGV